ncbi:putative membrane protein [Escherichia coli MP021552.7]|nr:putative membrane protein [Escherichia coli MP021552.7]EMU71371.1 putative membrane protein [Escherichia coli MP021552.12]EMX38062.1 putative membrane protein [Escherichia coli MP021552.8]
MSSQLLSFLLFCISLLSAAMWIWKSLDDHKSLSKIKAR